MRLRAMFADVACGQAVVGVYSELVVLVVVVGEVEGGDCALVGEIALTPPHAYSVQRR